MMSYFRTMWLLSIIFACHISISICDHIATTKEKCLQTIPKLEALPGLGWDSIRNTEMGRVLELTYDECRATEDRMYLIPDNIYVVAVKDSSLQTTSEFIEHWLNYTSVVSWSFELNAGINIFGKIGVQGSFDISYLDAKKKQVGEKSMTTRIQARNSMYVVQSQPNSKIDSGLKSVLDKVIETTESKNYEKADLLCQFIVRDYGTHYIDKATAGAVLLEEDYFDSNFINQKDVTKLKIQIAAGASFFKKFIAGGSSKFTFENDQTFLTSYEKSKSSSTIRSIGGALVSSNMTLDDWIKQIPNNLVVIDRAGNPLSFLVTPERFPNVSINTLNNVRKQLDQVIKDYYAYNTHHGCTDVNSANFDYSANIPGSCQSPANNYSLGGGYITCQSKHTGAGDLCEHLNVKNPLSGLFQCQPGYEAIPLTENTLTKNYKTAEKRCSGWWIFKSCWVEDVVKHSESYYSSFWCISKNLPKNNTGFMFGGLYSSWMENPVTKDRSCPVAYISLTLAPDLKVCVSNAYDTGYQYSAPFGGFFSCQHGNPLTQRLNLLSAANGNAYLHTCPHGYSQRMAIVDNGCAINYCIKLGSNVGQVNVVLPPFRNQSAMYIVTSVPKSQNDDPKNASGVTIAIIVVGVVSTLILAIGGSVYVIKKRRNGHTDDASESNREREALIQ